VRPGEGVLVLVATPIGNLGDLSPRAAAALREADVVSCEDTRHTRHLLTAAGITGRSLIAVHEHNEASMVASVLGRLQRGERIALVSDAGTPGISDPGERLVRAAASAGIRVEIVPGPSAAVAALVVSGLSTDRWCFEGFLPRKGRERRERLAELAVETRTMVIYEAPHRLAATLSDLASALGAERPVAVVRELTKAFEETWRGTLGQAATRANDPDGVVRGEHVIVIEGVPRAAETTDDEILSRLRESLALGTSRKEAVAEVAGVLAVSRRRVYQLALHAADRPKGGG
jgi:16S rRNA (cytidine1402-2'-O)-methyltransferase